MYFHAMRQDLRLEAERLARTVSRALGTYVEPDLEEVFRSLAERGRVVVVIDEFTHWVEEDPRILTVLQRLWDEYLAQSRVFLLLVASAATLVERSFSYGSALYGRRTGQWRLGELEPRFVRDFLPGYGLEELVAVYGCAGGVPFYLSLFDPSKSLEDNINSLFFSKGGLLYEEAENLLRYELREPSTYFNIVRAIEEGATSYSENPCTPSRDYENQAILLASMIRAYFLYCVKQRLFLLPARSGILKRWWSRASNSACSGTASGNTRPCRSLYYQCMGDYSLKTNKRGI